VKLSIIIPVYDEADNILNVYQELCELTLPPAYKVEIVIVDDLSTDQTPKVLNSIQSTSDNIVVIRHPQRLGQSAAIASGISASDGEIIVTMDGDGQNVAQDIAILLAQLCPRTACVNGVRSVRHDPRLKVFSSQVANRARRWLLNDPIIDAGCGLKVIRRDALCGLPYFNGMHRFLPSMLHMQGHVVRQVFIQQRERKSGRSKYGIGNRLWKGLVDCVAMLWFRRYCFSHLKMQSHTASSTLSEKSELRDKQPLSVHDD
jgi:dolichol-phosphate mannosyltransferase